MSTPALGPARTCALITALLLAASAPAAFASTTVNESAHRPALQTTISVAAAGAGWIARDMSKDGALVDAASHQPNATDTTTAVMALEAAGYGANQIKAATTWLEHNYESYVTIGKVEISGRLALLILAAVAAGANPYRFGGTGNENDLVARLEAIEQMSGASAGEFGASPYANDFYQALSILALAAVRVKGQVLSLATKFLEGLQCSDGGWEYSRLTTSIACAAPNPANYSSPDTNTTALAVQAIVAVGGRFAHNPLGFFESSEEANASFGVYGVSGHGQQGDPDSTAYVVQALVALHALNSPGLVRHGSTPETALAAFQLGCKAPTGERGEFVAFGAPSQLATLQAVPAAAERAFPIRPGNPSTAEPQLSCGGH